MDAARVHLFLNYFPLIGTLLGIVMLVFGFWKRSDRVKRISLVVFFLTAVLAFAVYASGEVAGSGAGKLVGPVWTNIGTHKASALPAFAAIVSTGLFALIGLISMFRKSELARWNVLALLIFSLAALSLTARTTYLGARIHSIDAAVSR